MLKANEAKTILTQAIENEVNERKNIALKFCEEISEDIIKRAKERYNCLTVIVDNNVRAYVLAELKDNGYSVAINKTEGTITIMW